MAASRILETLLSVSSPLYRWSMGGSIDEEDSGDGDLFTDEEDDESMLECDYVSSSLGYLSAAKPRPPIQCWPKGINIPNSDCWGHTYCSETMDNESLSSLSSTCSCPIDIPTCQDEPHDPEEDYLSTNPHRPEENEDYLKAWQAEVEREDVEEVWDEDDQWYWLVQSDENRLAFADQEPLWASLEESARWEDESACFFPHDEEHARSLRASSEPPPPRDEQRVCEPRRYSV